MHSLTSVPTTVQGIPSRKSKTRATDIDGFLHIIEIVKTARFELRQSLGIDVRILTLIRMELRARAFGNFQRFQRHVRLKGLPHWSVCRKCTIYWFIISSRERHGSLTEIELR